LITAHTKVVGLFGWPLGHSLSPALQNAAFTAAGIDAVYLPFPVEPERLEQAVDAIRALNFAGVNVTIPHKVAVIPYLDEIDISAQLVGAVNTIVHKDGRCRGYNTDAEGFIRSLTTKGISIADRTAVVVGAGGAARAIVAGLIAHACKEIFIGARNEMQAVHLAKAFSGAAEILGMDWRANSFTKALQGCNLLINCTPLGMNSYSDHFLPVDWSHVNSGTVVCDLVYNPPMTDFLHAAQKRGHITVSGAGMLLEQGILAFALWTGKPAPRVAMEKILYDELAVRL